MIKYLNNVLANSYFMTTKYFIEQNSELNRIQKENIEFFDDMYVLNNKDLPFYIFIKKRVSSELHVFPTDIDVIFVYTNMCNKIYGKLNLIIEPVEGIHTFKDKSEYGITRIIISDSLDFTDYKKSNVMEEMDEYYKNKPEYKYFEEI